MKKITSIIVAIFIILIFTLEFSNFKLVNADNNYKGERNNENNVTIEQISNKIIRFHVIANSDGKLDQELKLKVRDKVLEYIQPILKKSRSLEESRKILKEENEKILDIANEVIYENGYSYKVQSTLSKEYFPIKTYGNITLPQGEYEAYRIIIGDGEGQNWWCVMFPPICFVDITKGEVAYEETENEMKSVLSEDEFNMVNNKNDESYNNDINIIDNTEENNIIVKFKFIELLKNIFK